MRTHQEAPYRRALAAVVVSLLGALLLVACSDGGPSEATPTSMPEEALPSPTATPEEGSALPLESYAYVATVKVSERRPGGAGNEVVFTTWGSYQTPDRHAFTYSLKLADETTTVRRAVIIGDDAWMRTNKKHWQAIPPDDPDLEDLLATAFTSKRAEFLGGPAFEEMQASVRRLPSQEEAANGVPADHYQVGAAGSEFLDSFLAGVGDSASVSDLSWDLWLAKDGGWPVRLVATANVARDMPEVAVLGLKAPADWEFRIEIYQPNDPALKITPPLRGA